MKKYWKTLILLPLLFGGVWIWRTASTGKPRAGGAPGNFIFAISPYRSRGTWVFTDLRAGLIREPFINGIPEMIDEMVKEIPDAEKGFRLLFSSSPFPGYAVKLEWRRKEQGGNWYYSAEYNAEGWLCPALFKYFKKAPKELYARAEAISH